MSTEKEERKIKSILHSLSDLETLAERIDSRLSKFSEEMFGHTQPTLNTSQVDASVAGATQLISDRISRTQGILSRVHNELEEMISELPPMPEDPTR